MSERRVGAGVKPIGERKAAARRAKKMSPPSPLDVIAAALTVSQRLEIDGQLHAFLDVARGWTQARDGVAFGPDLEGLALAPLAMTLESGDPRLESLRQAVRSRGALALARTLRTASLTPLGSSNSTDFRAIR